MSSNNTNHYHKIIPSPTFLIEGFNVLSFLWQKGAHSFERGALYEKWAHTQGFRMH